MRNTAALLLVIFLLPACKNNEAYQKAEDAEDAGREFIRASLDGDYDKAYFYLYKDATQTNVMLLDKWKKDYNSRKEEDKVKYKNASIIAINIQPVNDSTVTYRYTNSFEIKDTTTIRVIKDKGDWLVDLKDIY